jgi:uncharacterized protein YdhG (YjbR/CyaY superfamily)
VFVELEEELLPYSKSKGALHFALDEPLPKEIVAKLIKVRLASTARVRRLRHLRV